MRRCVLILRGSSGNNHSAHYTAPFNDMHAMDHVLEASTGARGISTASLISKGTAQLIGTAFLRLHFPLQVVESNTYHLPAMFVASIGRIPELQQGFSKMAQLFTFSTVCPSLHALSHVGRASSNPFIVGRRQHVVVTTIAICRLSREGGVKFSEKWPISYFVQQYQVQRYHCGFFLQCDIQKR